ncbi:vomeronasal type-1 receptor 4-like [Ctenodactylus gundi]
MPRTIAAFGLRNFLSNAGCKIISYLERVARGLSICTSSLLTVVQAIIMSPRHSRWKKLKPRSAWHILPLLLFFWILNSLISVNLLFYITSISTNTSNISKLYSYCYFRPANQKMKWIFLILMMLRDGLFQGVMGGASGYMVFLLYKHNEHILHLQNSKLLYKTPPEIKAAQSVLFLMLCFIFFYWVDCILSLFINSFLEDASVLINIRDFVTLGYAILSPFVLIHRNEYLTKCYKAQQDRKTLRKCSSLDPFLK